MVLREVKGTKEIGRQKEREVKTVKPVALLRTLLGIPFILIER